ncbi:MAG: sulfotransferase family 2 domain-containing protein [Halieaceae bacterium]|jgi:hypothetical protein|nr:sulfotransferase family 2 domain-containing protein [Halieaceae bacterium]
MVISEKHRYVFIQIPMTGCTAVASELVQQYDGRYILSKHSTYKEFLQQANSEERSYSVFTNIRDPFDRLVSHYHKFLSNHEDYLNPEKHKYQSRKTTRYHLARVTYIRQAQASFPDYFAHFYSSLNPMLPPPQLAIGQAQYVVKFENLENNFLNALQHLGINAERGLPLVNQTPGRKGAYVDHYDQGITELAVSALGPFARYWGYKIPPAWSLSIPQYATSLFNLKMMVRKVVS